MAVAVALVVASCSGSDGESLGDVPTTDDAPQATTDVVPPVTDAPDPTAPATPAPVETTATPPPAPTDVATSTSVAATTTSPDPADADTPLLDLTTGEIGGYGFGSSADGLVEELTGSLGEPSRDTDWLPVGPFERCSFNDEHRYVGWDDLLFLLERAPDQEPVVGAWTLGGATPLGPVAPERPGDAMTGITTATGAGIGSRPSDLDVAFDTFNNDEVLSISGLPVFGSISNGTITDLTAGPLDCPALDLSEFSCDRPIPIRELPDGTRTSDVSVDEGAASWGVDSAGPNGENLVTQILAGPDPAAAQAARESSIGAQFDPLEVRVVAAADPVSSQAEFFVFDSDTDCVRLLRVGPGLDADRLQAYADVLVDQLEERR
ncbi:MAG: hypothetical protein WA964_13785 [Ilumatobacter sp.]|uniref:hypothetical protein n=1 Tax=Ilumatobacter sp. TaxID=1967498 RepID=UPI003C78EC44